MSLSGGARGLATRLHRRFDRLFRRPFPEPPLLLAAGIGAGDWRAVGAELGRLVIAAGKLERDARVLDLGCGLGRVAQSLRRHLSPRASYTGLDVSSSYIEWDRAEISSRDPRFRFVHVDVHSGAYSEEGVLDAAALSFPFADSSFDFVLATSLFTHLHAAAAEHYVEEAARVIAPGGTFFATFYLLDDDVRSRIASGRVERRFAHPLPHGATDDPRVPENAIAFERGWLLEVLAASGFRLARPVARGAWCGEPEAPTFQDLVIAYNAGRDPTAGGE